MLQQIGYLISLVFALLTGVFILMGIYVGYKHYGKLPSDKKTGIRYFILAILSWSLALFIFLTIENGFTWEILGISVCLAIILILLLKIDNFIRTRTATYLDKRNVLSPLSSINKLINTLINKHPSDQDFDKENKK